MREVVSKAVRSLDAGKLFDCPRVIKSCFNAYVLPSLKYCAPVLISSAESHLGLQDGAVRSAELLREGEICFLMPVRERLPPFIKKLRQRN